MRTTWVAVLMAASMAGLTATRQAPPAAQSARPLTPTAIASPAGADSAQPQLTTSARGVLLSWIERRGAQATLKFAEWTAGAWSAPRIIASGEDWFVNWADVPSVMRLEDGSLAAHWLQRSGPERYAYDVRLAHSEDDGRTWSASFTPHHDGTKTEHGFASLFQVPGSGLGVLWLDGRATTPTATHADGHAAAGAMTVRAGQYDAQWRQVADAAIDLRACDCCPTSVAVTSDGPIAAWRDRSDDEIRDIVVSRLEGGSWTTPRRVHADGWRIQACPVNGPSLAARDRAVALAWFTAVGDEGHAYAALSADAGRTFGPPIRLDGASALGRVDVALLDDGAALASWIELQGTAASFAMRRITRAGVAQPPVRVAVLDNSRSSGYPRLAVHGGEVVLAWTETGRGTSRVRAATVRLDDLATLPPR